MSLGEDRDTKQLSGFQKMESPRLGTLVVWVANDGIPSFGNLGARGSWGLLLLSLSGETSLLSPFGGAEINHYKKYSKRVFSSKTSLLKVNLCMKNSNILFVVLLSYCLL